MLKFCTKNIDALQLHLHWNGLLSQLQAMKTGDALVTASIKLYGT